MSGTVAGGKAAYQTNIKRQGPNFMKRIGAKGGKNGSGPDYSGGFGNGEAGKELARRAGRLGGKASRRGSPNKAIIVKDEETEMTAAELKEMFGTQEPELTHPKLFNKIRRFF